MLMALLATLHIMAQNGAIYDIVENVPDGACIMGRAEELVYEASSINVCDTITLPAGCYRVELMGGMGGSRSDCLVEMGQRITTPVIIRAMIVYCKFSTTNTIWCATTATRVIQITVRIRLIIVCTLAYGHTPRDIGNITAPTNTVRI
mgnify:CR=1 FL=1